MLFQPLPTPAAEREQAPRNPERETLLLAATGATTVLGAPHSAILAG